MNAYELWLKQKLEEKGWTVLRNGWPDFLCFKGDLFKPTEVLAVEGKRGTQLLTYDQLQIHTILRAAGVPCEVLRPSDVRPDNQLRIALAHEYYKRSNGKPFEHRATCPICLGETERGTA